MLTQLDVVNDCLAIMGEARLNSLSEDHPFKDAVVDKLAKESLRMQAKGWWFNTESMRLTPDRLDRRIKLPSDLASTITFDKRPNLVQRGLYVYDLENGGDTFPDGTVLNARFVRNVPFEDLPVSFASYVAATVVLWFQGQYDGDATKTRDLRLSITALEADAKAEHIRNRKVNLLDSNQRLARIRNTIRQFGRY